MIELHEKGKRLNRIVGDPVTLRVTVDGKELDLQRSLKVWNHSPTGFNWGYSGSGPAQLALAILLQFTDKATAKSLHQKFKNEVVAGLPQGNFSIDFDVKCWIATRLELT